MLALLPFLILLASAFILGAVGPIRPAPAILVGSGFLICIMLFAVGHFLQNESTGDTQLSETAHREIRATNLVLLQSVSLALAAATALGVVLGLESPQGVHPTFPVWMLGFTALALIWGFMRVTRKVRNLRDRGLLEGIEGWNGLTYRNPNDPRIWVPKISGAGYTLNFAHRKSWAILGLLLSPAVIGLGLAVCSYWRRRNGLH